MPKLGTRTVPVPGGKHIEITLYYVTESNYSSNSVFIAIPPKEYLIPLAEGISLTRTRSRGKDYIGITGSSEQEALNNMKQYLEDFTRLTGKKTIYLYIRRREEPSTFYGTYEEDNKYESSIEFEYTVGYAMELPSGIKHFETGKDKDSELYRADERYFKLPWSQELEDKCAAMVRNLQVLQQAFTEALSDPERAADTISNSMFIMTRV